MSTSKLKLNPDKLYTVYTLLYYFLINIEDNSPLCHAKSVRNLGVWIFPCLNMFRMSAKVVGCNSVTSDMTGDFLLMMLLYQCSC